MRRRSFFKQNTSYTYSLSVTSLDDFDTLGNSQTFAVTSYRTNDDTGETEEIDYTSSISGTGYSLDSNTITTTENQSLSARSGILTVSNEGKTINVDLNQNAGYYTYSDVSISDGSVAIIPASGGSVSSVSDYTYSQTCGWNGRTSGIDTLTSGGTISYSTEVSAASKGTTISNTTTAGTLTLTVSMNGKSGSKSYTVNQAGNYVTGVSTSLTGFSYPNVAASGGAANFSETCGATLTFTSGDSISDKHSGTYTGGTISYTATYTGSATGATLNTSTGAVTWASRGTTTGDARSISVTYGLSYYFTHDSTYGGSKITGNTDSMTATCTQAANAITATTYGTPTGLSLAVSDISAAGGTISSGTVSGTISQTRTYTYTSTSTSSSTINPTASSASYSTAISASSLGTTLASRTSKGTLTYYYTCNGKQGSASATVYQAANTRALNYVWLSPYQPDSSWIVTVTNGNWNTCPASGGYVKCAGYYNYTYTSGSTKDEQQTADASLTWSSTSYISAHVNGGYHIASRGTTAGDARSVTCTWTSGGMTSSAKTLTQAANAITSYSYGSWGGGAVSFSSTGALSAGADSRTVYIQPWSRSKTPVYTSGSSGSASTEYYTGSVSVSENGSYTSLNATSYTASSSAKSLTLTKSTCGTTVVSATTVTVTATGATTTTGSISQSANTDKASSKITAYGTPSVSIGSGITAAGGSATITRSVSNTRTYYYTSGSAGSSVSEAGTVTLSIVSNGNSRFSLSGTTLSHSTMGTNICVTDTCTVRAYNASSTGYYKDASVSVSNKISSVSFNINAGSIASPGTFSAGAESKYMQNSTSASFPSTGTATLASGSSAAITLASYGSWNASDVFYSNACSNTSYFTISNTSSNTCYVTSVSRGTSCGDARTATITRTASGTFRLYASYSSTGADQTFSDSSAATATITQAANRVTACAQTSSVSPGTIGHSSGTISASGATVAVSSKTAPSYTGQLQLTFSSGSTYTGTSYTGWGSLSIAYSWSSSQSWATVSSTSSSANVVVAKSTSSSARTASITRTATPKFTANSVAGSGIYTLTGLGCSCTIAQSASVTYVFTSDTNMSGVVMGMEGIQANITSTANGSGTAWTVSANTMDNCYYNGGASGSSTFSISIADYESPAYAQGTLKQTASGKTISFNCSYDP